MRKQENGIITQMWKNMIKKILLLSAIFLLVFAYSSSALASLQAEQQTTPGFLPYYAVEPTIGGSGYCIVIETLGAWSSTD